MILRENVNPSVGRRHFLGVLDVKNRGERGGGGSEIQKYIGNTSMCKENLNV